MKQIKLIIGIGAILISSLSIAQTPAIQPDDFISPGSPQHLGNSAVGNYLSVSCWDGPTPQFYFESTLFSGTLPITSIMDPSIRDPDVVVFPGSVKFCIVYAKGNQIYAELWQHEGPGCELIDGPFMISDGGSSCARPNVDQLANGAAFVWQQDGEIKGRYWDLTLGLLTNPTALGDEVLLSGCYRTTPISSGYYSNRQPDISIYKEGSEDVANVVFVSYNYITNEEKVIIQRMDLDDFFAGLPVSCLESEELMPAVSSPSQYNNPRIASPPIGAAADYRDCEAVVLLNEPGTNYVIGINRYSTPTYTPTSLNSFLGAFNCYNAFPVVSYTGCGNILVEWEYNNTLGCIPDPALLGNNILGRRLDVTTGFPVDPIYSYVNMTIGSMLRPAVSGRYRSASGLNAYSTYTDGFAVYQKYSPCFTPSLRKKNIVEEEQFDFSIYPNPVAEVLNIELNWEEDQLATLKVIDVSGKEVLHTSLERGKNTLSIREFTEGLYFFNVTINNEIIQSSKFIVKH